MVVLRIENEILTIVFGCQKFHGYTCMDCQLYSDHVTEEEFKAQTKEDPTLSDLVHTIQDSWPDSKADARSFVAWL